MSADQMTGAIITAVISGGVSAISAVAAIRVNIKWLERQLMEMKQSLGRAHQRIDDMRDSK